MEKYIKVIEITIKCMGKEHLLGQIIENMLEIT